MIFLELHCLLLVPWIRRLCSKVTGERDVRGLSFFQSRSLTIFPTLPNGPSHWSLAVCGISPSSPHHQRAAAPWRPAFSRVSLTHFADHSAPALRQQCPEQLLFRAQHGGEMTEDNREELSLETAILRGAASQQHRPAGRECGEGVLFIPDLLLFDLIGKSEPHWWQTQDMWCPKFRIITMPNRKTKVWYIDSKCER